jgi:hypothetical protein
MRTTQAWHWKLVMFGCSVATIATGLTVHLSAAQAEQGVQFICAQVFDKQKNRLPTTLAVTPRGKVAVIRWVSSMGAMYSQQKRCEEVSPRFQEAYNNGTLNLITNGVWNRQPVICTVSKLGDGCHTLLMTLRSGDDSLKLLNELKNILNGRQRGPIKHSSGIPQAYVQINIQEFLQSAPVEPE